MRDFFGFGDPRVRPWHLLVCLSAVDRSVLVLCLAPTITFAICAVVDSEYAIIGLMIAPPLIAGLVIFAFQFTYFADLADKKAIH
jgi:hypothetical protein